MVMSTFSLYLISFVVSLVFGTLILMLVAKIFKQKKVFTPSLIVVLIVSVVGFLINLLPLGAILNIILVLGVILNIILVLGVIVLEIFLIKKFFNVDWGRALGMWAVWIGFMIIFVLILITVLWTIIANILQGGIDDITKNIDLLNRVILSLF